MYAHRASLHIYRRLTLCFACLRQLTLQSGIGCAAHHAGLLQDPLDHLVVFVARAVHELDGQPKQAAFQHRDQMVLPIFQV